MDTSEQYIKMCQEAHEIQEIGKNNFAVGDWYSSGLAGTYLLIDAYNDNDGWSIWLPRQDQLQEIAGGPEIYPVYRMQRNLLNFLEYQYHTFKSHEELWLSFIMKEKFNKRWNFEKEIWESINWQS